MMTPAQIKNYEFKAAGRNAYKSDDVDSFFGEVLVNYEKLYRENIEFVKRLNLLADRLEKYKAEEVDIKQAVLSAQKAADIIQRDAEESAEQIKEEAESILAAAKGEANIIKADAEKQAIADSDLLLAMARDKAEDIIKKAKEKAHGILIAANNSASDTVGAANRTITSESIHYDMLKKEVSEFRASILAQYKAHIEMISKLPELAVEEAGKVITEVPEIEITTDEIDALDSEESIDKTEAILEIENEQMTVDSEFNEAEVEEDIESFDFTDGISSTEEASEEFSEESSDFEPHYADIPISKKITINTNDIVFDGFEADDSDCDTFSDEAESEDIPDDDTCFDENFSENNLNDSADFDDVNNNDIEVDSTAVADETPEDKRDRYARFFGDEDDADEEASDDNDDSYSSFFDSIETVESNVDDSDESASKSKFSFFRKKK